MLKFQRLLPLAVVLVAGCGGSSPPKPKAPVPAPRTVKVCSGLTDTCHTITVPAPTSFTAPKLAPHRFVDVSSYQGHPNWGAAKAAGIVGAVVKSGEGSSFTDSSFAYNWRQLRALHLWHSSYYFLRPSNCSGQADRMAAIVKASGGFDSGPPVIDAEVRLPAGCVLEFAARIHALTGRIPVIYTAPGTWPGGSHGGLALWQATYGASFRAFWSPVLAWQCSQGTPGEGCTAYVPGVGYGDLSIDYGLTKLVPGPGPVRCFGPHAKLDDRRCQAPRATVGARNAEIRRLRAQMLRRGCRKTILTGPVSFPVPKVVPGRNARRAFCVRLFRLGAADHRFIDAAIRRTY